MRRIAFSFLLTLLTLLFALPLAAQDWDLRLEIPVPEGQSLQGTMASGTIGLISDKLDTGNGAIFSMQHRLIRVGPILRLDWGGELSYLTAGGNLEIANQNVSSSTKLKQYGIGIGVNAQLWIPFIGISGEIGAIQRFQRYNFSSQQDASAPNNDKTIGRTWLRVGIRYRIPSVGVYPYLAASYQQPINKDQPVKIGSLEDLAGYFQTQGKGREFQRMWTFGVGLTF
ncbi:MAG: hypothetical protein LBQ86_09125 [Holophagales bacterium]|jgi:hypothetical protein|nr:hypothetical protein [Holophagales bacterium]